MRSGNDGRETVFPWSDAQPVEVAAYAVGGTVYSGDCRGAVVSVDAKQGTMGVVWEDANTELDRDPSITYPIDATYLRKALPWES